MRALQNVMQVHTLDIMNIPLYPQAQHLEDGSLQLWPLPSTSAEYCFAGCWQKLFALSLARPYDESTTDLFDGALRLLDRLMVLSITPLQAESLRVRGESLRVVRELCFALPDETLPGEVLVSLEQTLPGLLS